MSENAVATVERADLSITEWRERGDIDAFARRLRVMLPGGNRLSPENAMALAQYSLAMNLNPYRGEVHGFESKGRFVIVDGYKALVRWAQWRAPYTESFTQMQAGDPELPEGAIGFRCSILREDRLHVLSALVGAGVPYDQALERIETTAVGVVTLGEMAKDPPTGWTWEQRARIRALKNALNISHGMPSPNEIQRAAEAEAEQYNDDRARDEALPAERAVRGLFKTEPKPAPHPDPEPQDTVEGEWLDAPEDLEQPADEVEEPADTDDGDELLRFFGVGDIPQWVLALRRQAEQAPGASDPIPGGSATGLIANLARKLDGDTDRARRFVRWVWCCEPEELTKAMFNLTGKLNGDLAERVAELEALA